MRHIPLTPVPLDPSSRLRLRLRVIVLGDTHVGKTALLDRYVDNIFTSQYTPTVGVTYRAHWVTLSHDRSLRLRLHTWDLGGAPSYREVRREFYTEEFQGALLVFDVLSRRSFDALEVILDDVARYDPAFTTRMHVVVCGNKAAEDRGTRRVVSMDEAREWARSHGFVYVEASAKSGNEVDTAFETLIRGSYEVLLTRDKEQAVQGPLEQVKMELATLRSLPPAQRDRQRKLLCARWHPDKNQGNEAVATAIFQFIQSEFE